MNDVVLAVEGLGKSYRTYAHQTQRVMGWLTGVPRGFHDNWVLRDITFSLRRGESVGVLGRNGAGKSTLLKLIAGTIAPTEGSLQIAGRVNAILELGVGFNPEFTGRENVLHSLGLMGHARDEVEAALPSIEAFAEIGAYFDRPLRIYSSGMQMRLAFAAVTAFRPDILIIDEALAVGDAAFQRKCFDQLEQIIASGTVVLFVSHDTEAIKRFCQRAVWLVDGRLRQIGIAKTVCETYERYLLGHDTPTAPTAPALTVAPSLDTSLTSTSRVDYGTKAAVIEQLWLTDALGQTVNVIPDSVDFTVNYHVRFMEECRNVWFGMTVKTVEGITVYAVHTRQEHTPRDFRTGQAAHIRFELQNGLAPGTYFLNCGANHATPQGREVLHRLIDAALLKVTNQAGPISYSGIANLKARVTIQQISCGT